MKLSDFFSLILKFGIQNDPRIDKRCIKNYSDSAILYGDPDTNIKNISRDFNRHPNNLSYLCFIKRRISFFKGINKIRGYLVYYFYAFV